MEAQECAEVAALQSVFIPEHNHIGEQFARRVSTMLSGGSLEIKRYAVTNEKWEDEEIITFVVDDHRTLTVSLKRSK